MGGRIWRGCDSSEGGGAKYIHEACYSSSVLQHGRERREPEGSASVSQAALSRTPAGVQRGAAGGGYWSSWDGMRGSLSGEILWVETQP